MIPNVILGRLDRTFKNRDIPIKKKEKKKKSITPEFKIIRVLNVLPSAFFFFGGVFNGRPKKSVAVCQETNTKLSRIHAAFNNIEKKEPEKRKRQKHYRFKWSNA